MKKFCLAACLVLLCFVGCGVKTTFAASYSDAQAMEAMRSIIRQLKTDPPVLGWSHRKSDWRLCAAEQCYAATSGIIYTIMERPGVNSLWVITQVDLDSNSFRMVEGYVFAMTNYSLSRLDDSKIAKNWRSEEIFTDYCGYLRANYKKINGV